MNTTSIEKTFQQLLNGKVPVYVIAAQETEKLSYDNCPFIVCQNTDVGPPGEHWIGWWVYSRANADYFDSFGLSIEKYVNVIPPATNIVQENCRQIQQGSSFVCGEHVIYWAYHRAMGVSYEHIMGRFLKSLWYNDRLAVHFVKCVKGCHRHSLYDMNRCVQSCKCKTMLYKYF